MRAVSAEEPRQPRPCLRAILACRLCALEEPPKRSYLDSGLVEVPTSCSSERCGAQEVGTRLINSRSCSYYARRGVRESGAHSERLRIGVVRWTV